MKELDVPLNRGERHEDVLATLKAQMYIDDFQEKDEEDVKQVLASSRCRRGIASLTRSRIHCVPVWQQPVPCPVLLCNLLNLRISAASLMLLT